MKRKSIRNIILLAVTSALLTSCGGGKDEPAEQLTSEEVLQSEDYGNVLDYKASDYITITYKENNKTVNVPSPLSDDIISCANSFYQTAAASVTEYEDVIQPVAGDLITIRYKSKVDGRETGLSKKETFELGTNYHYQEFDEALLDVICGETIEVPVQIPEDASSENAGKEVIFVIEVKGVPKEAAVYAACDKKYDASSPITDRESLQKYAKEYLSEENRKSAVNEAAYAILSEAVLSIDFNDNVMPLTKEFSKRASRDITYSYTEYGNSFNGEEADKMDRATFCETYYGADEEYMETIVSYDSQKFLFAALYIAQNENIVPTDEQFTEILNEKAKNGKFGSLEGYLLSRNITLSEAKEEILYEKVIEWLGENMVEVE